MQKFILMFNFLTSEKHEETFTCVKIEYVGNSWDGVRSCDPIGLKSVVALSPGPNSRRWHHPHKTKQHTRPQRGTCCKHRTRGKGKAVPKAHARPLQRTHLPATYPWIFFMTTKSRTRLSKDFPNGMYSLPVHQSSSSVLVCQGIMPATEQPTSPAISVVWLTAFPVLLFWESWQEHTHTRFGFSRTLCFA